MSPTPAFPPRADLARTHDAILARMSGPGTWWSGAERLAIAAQARAAWSCDLCSQRKNALSPSHVQGRHTAAPYLSAAAVDAAHRVVTDPARLTGDDIRRWAEEGLGDGAYVELVGVVSKVMCLDFYAEALSLPLRALPEPRPGPPSRRRPEGLNDEGAWVPLIGQRLSRGPEADLYVEGFMPRVVRALSLSPDEVRGLKALMSAHYLAGHRVPNNMEGSRAISRPQMELLAVRVSAFNECFF